MSRIVITDPHGCFKSLVTLVNSLPINVPITFAGDLVDRGPNSRDIIEFVKANGYDCVLGNHEQMMIDAIKFIEVNGVLELEKIDYQDTWMLNGGEQTLDNYVNADGTYDIVGLKAHVDWLKSLPYHILYPNEVNGKGQALLVTHSTASHVYGKVDSSNPQFIDHVTWMRDPMPPKIPNIYNVYGHTPQYYGPTVKDHFACIDGGCAYKKPGYGKLFALQFPEMDLHVQDNIEEKK